MIERFHTRFGIPGVISVFALVFAMVGGAYAANNMASSSGGKASAKAKVKRGPRGPKGPKGAKGATGAPGLAGANGKDGARGSDGAPGAKGQDGVSVTTSAANTTECPTGGIKVLSASPVAKVCNGAVGATGATGAQGIQGPPGVQGIQGPPGAPGAPGPTCPTSECLLPSGSTVTGKWAINDKGIAKIYTAISFPLSLPPGEAPEFHYVTSQEVNEVTAPAACPGSSFEPKALGEQLCMYETQKSNLALPNTAGSPGATGVALSFVLTDPNTEAFAFGSWAMTAP